MNKAIQTAGFATEVDEAGNDLSTPWSILVLDEDKEFYELISKLSGDATFSGRGIKLWQVNNIKQAKEFVNERTDTSLIIFSQIIEENESAIVSYIRSDLAETKTQVILVTDKINIVSQIDAVDKKYVSSYLKKAEVTESVLFEAFSMAFSLYTGNEIYKDHLPKQRQDKDINSKENKVEEDGDNVLSHIKTDLPSRNAWKIMIVDDDKDVHLITEIALSDLKFHDKPLEYIHAYSAHGAIGLIDENPDVSLLLLDMIMEDDRAGLKVVEHIRKQNKLDAVRIILRTGQPGDLSAKSLMTEYDINDFKSKTELTSSYLYASVYSSLRSYWHIEMLEQQREQLSKVVGVDFLTGLPNRHLLTDYLASSIDRSTRHKSLMGLMLIDLDRFKFVNDIMGHACGDILITQVVKRISHCLRTYDKLFRVGGDEFIVVLDDIDSLPIFSLIAKRINKSASEVFYIEDKEAKIAASIGISLLSEGKDADLLIKEADIAMYQTKNKGGNDYCFFTKEMNDSIERRTCLVNKLGKALDNNEFELYYQPQVDIKTSKVNGVEALLRWHEPDVERPPPPDVFIPYLEDTGLIKEVGFWVFEEACERQRTWLKEGLGDLKMGINVSPVQLRDENFANRLQDIIIRTGVEPSKVIMEITENVFIDDQELTLKCLNEIREIGMKVSLDDFGTGYSSLGYLIKFPIDELKVDKIFVQDIHNERNKKMLNAIIAMAHTVHDYSVVAEGVETARQLEIIAQAYCDTSQGYFFSRPLTTKDIVPLLKEYKI